MHDCFAVHVLGLSTFAPTYANPYCVTAGTRVFCMAVGPAKAANPSTDVRPTPGGYRAFFRPLNMCRREEFRILLTRGEPQCSPTHCRLQPCALGDQDDCSLGWGQSRYLVTSPSSQPLLLFSAPRARRSASP
jgi:hypothetical protein